MSHLEIERERILREKEQNEREEAFNEESSTIAGEALFHEKEGSFSLRYPMLTKSNYAAWAIKMEVYMMAQGVWDAIESPSPIDKRRDKMALAAIYKGIGEDTLLQLGAKKTAKEAWNMLKTMNQGANKVKEVRTQSLWREFEALRMSDSENVDDFSGKLTIIVNKLRSLGNAVEDEKVVKKLLRSVSSKFLQIAATIEEFSDLTTKSVEEVIGSLKAYKERLLSSGIRSEEILLLTEAEWKAKEEVKKKGKSKETTSSRGRGRGRYGGRYQRQEEEPLQKKKFDKSKIKCYNCGNMGHFASECLSKEKDEQANLTEKDDDEPALLMTEACEPKALQEETCMAAVKGIEVKEKWYLDSAASNHMIGDENCFTEIDFFVNGNVKIGDGIEIGIHGLGPVLFQCKNGEHLILTDVYFIPKLRSNIISLGQFDENGGRVDISGGLCKVYDRDNKLLIKVRRQSNRLYTAKLQVAQKICLMVSIADVSWLWHARYGYLNFQALKMLSKQKMVKGLPEITQLNQVCDGCMVGKQHRTPFPHIAVFRAEV